MADPTKIALRNSLKQVRSQLSTNYKTTASRHICTRIRSLELYRRAKHIGLYHAINGEIDLSEIWDIAPLHGKFCYFPVLNADLSLSFLPATPKTAFENNKFGIPEPAVSKDLAKPVHELDLILVPLVGFDLRCSRLGMGMGCYDRSLQNKNKCALIGVAYQFQLIDYLEPQSWDIPLDAVVTQKALYWREPSYG